MAGKGNKPLVYLREKGGEKILVAVQPAAHGAHVKIQKSGRLVPLFTHGIESTEPGTLKVGGVSFGIFTLNR